MAKLITVLRLYSALTCTNSNYSRYQQQLFTHLTIAVACTITAGEDSYYEIRLLTCGTERGTTADRLILRKPDLPPQPLAPAISTGTKVCVMSETGNELAHILQQLPDEAGTPSL